MLFTSSWGAKFGDGGGEGFAADGNFFAGEDDALFSGLETVDEPEPVFKDEGIDEDGFGFGLDDFVGGDGEFLLWELGGVFVLSLTGESAESIDLLVEDFGSLIALADQLGAIGAVGLLAFAGGELESEADGSVEGRDDGSFDRV